MDLAIFLLLVENAFKLQAKAYEKTSLAKYIPRSSSVLPPNTLRCLPRKYRYVIYPEGTVYKNKEFQPIYVYHTII